MTTYKFEEVGETPIPRDRLKRPLVIPVDGGKPVAYTRCTRFIDVIEDKYNLQKWKQRMVAVGVGSKRDLHLTASALSADPEGNKRALDDLCDAAREAAGANQWRTIGSALHALTEQLDRGQELGEVDLDFAPLLATYQQITADFEHVYIEKFLVNDEHSVGGTPDRISLVDGRLTVLDLKSGGTDYGHLNFAMQLAMYAHSDLYNPSTGERTPIEGIDQERGIIIGISAKTGDVSMLEVDLTAGWEAIKTAAAVREWRKRKNIAKPFFTTPPKITIAPTSAPIAALESAIRTAPNREALDQLWSSAGERWTDAHTHMAKERLASLEAA